MTAPLRPRTILIVDDNVTNLKVAVEHLRAYSYTLLTAATGAAGLERAQLAQPDLILLDILLPDIDGLETCRRLKANPATAAIPVIFMTALGDTADRVRGLEAGAVDYVAKPIEAAELLARVQTHLTLRDLQHRLEARVRERTAALEAETAQRQRANDEKDRLLDLVRQQSDHLRALTQQVLERRSRREQGAAQTLRGQVDEHLRALEQRLAQARATLQAPGPGAAAAALEALAQAARLVADIRQQTRHVSDRLEAEMPDDRQARDSPLFKLTTREYEVLQLILQGRSHAEIAGLLSIARPTVGTYRARLMHKLGVEDLPALMRFAVQHGWLS